ncbi:hypothetical protein CFD26_104719 [Aspergillus turcosus]|uniref:Copper transport protein n=1 Tax=Aspergillus turcosus TaxID=1245748 RepID=A0A3R7GBC3_9EURO|nr:hypothetical protein CFD26_104719 [Aspergillus turcosus]
MDESHHSKGMTMSTVFNTSTQITLFFRGWTTTTATSYTFTLIFLFALAVFNRVLGVLKFQLDAKHIETAEKGVRFPKLQLPTARRRRHAVPKDRMSPLPRYMAVAENDPENEAPFLGPDHERERTRDGHGLLFSPTQEPDGPLAQRRWWSACRRWSWRRDGTSSLLEGLRALVGYALMLAVMTFNVGVFCAVVGGIIVGELFLGRYANPSSTWQDVETLTPMASNKSRSIQSTLMELSNTAIAPIHFFYSSSISHGAPSRGLQTQWPPPADTTPYTILGLQLGRPYTKTRYYELVSIYHPEKRLAYDRSGAGWTHRPVGYTYSNSGSAGGLTSTPDLQHRRLAVLILVIAFFLQSCYFLAQCYKADMRARAWHEQLNRLLDRRRHRASSLGISEAQVQNFLLKRDPSGVGFGMLEEPVYREVLPYCSYGPAGF